MIKTAWAFIKRDFLLAISYRTAFIGQLLVIFLGVAVFYYIGRVFDGAASPVLASYGGNYFAFLLIGVAFADFLKVSLSTFNVSIRENQMMGTLEMMFLSPIPATLILVYSSLWSYLLASFRFLLYLLVGFLIFGFDLHNANFLGGFIVLVLSILCFSAFGIIMAAFIMVFKKGDMSTVMSVASVFLGGVMFPATVLPSWLKIASFLLPITHALNGMRQALILGFSLVELAPEMIMMAVFSIFLLPLGFWMFQMAVKQNKLNGTLTHY